ncbi:MAG TPA: PilZ domain-containing protein [Polyangia bacterium]
MTTPALDASSRRARRYRKASLVWYHVLDGVAAGEVQEGIGAGFDVSQSGFGITTPRPVPLGARVFVHLRCRELELTAVALVTRVRLAETAQCEIGLRILVAPPDQRAMLSRLFP